MRLYYATNVPIQIFPDSLSYWRTAQVYTVSRTIVDAWRTPVYPLFLLAISPGVFTIEPYLPPELLTRTVVIQSIIGITIAIGIFRVSRYMGVSKLLSILAAGLSIFNPYLILFEQVMLTETIAVLWLLITFIVVFQLIQKQSYVLYISMLFLFLIGVFLRPVFVLTPILLMGFIVAYNVRLRTIFVVCTLLLCFFIVISAYTYANFLKEGYAGISRVGEINLLGKMMFLDIPFTVDKENIWSVSLLEYKQQGGINNPWRLLDWNPTLYSIESLNQLSGFVRPAIKNEIRYFVIEGAKEIPEALISVTDEMPWLNKDGINGRLLSLWFAFYRQLFFLRYLIIVSSLWFFVRSIVKPSLLTKSGLLLSMFIIFHSLISIFLTYNDWGRHLIVYEPFVFLCLSMFITDMYKSLPHKFSRLTAMTR